MLNIGTVKWFDTFKGYGFIEHRPGLDIFVHFSAVQTHGYRSLNSGQRVSYQLARGKHGWMAINVTPLV